MSPKKVLILAAGRSGSSLLQNSICYGTKNSFNGGEFFSNEISHTYKHIRLISEYCERGYYDCLDLYKDFLCKLSNLKKDETIIEKNSLNENHVDYLLKNLNYDLFCFKLFKYQYEDSNKVDINKILNMMNCLILLYRKNLLLNFISLKKSFSSGLWYVSKCAKEKNINNIEKHKSTKITWNKKEYLNFYEQQINCFKEFKLLYNNFPKNKTIISYEEIENFDIHYLSDILIKELKIDYKIYKFKEMENYIPIKQSDGGLDIEENFENKEEFKSDYESIKSILYNEIF